MYGYVLEQQARLLQTIQSPAWKNWSGRIHSRLPDENRTTESYVEGMTHKATVLALRSDAYAWSPEMCELVDAASETLPDFILQPEHLLTRHGYFHFARPFENRERYPFSVHFMTFTSSGGIGEGGVSEGITMSFWTMLENGRPYPVGSAVWSFGKGHRSIAEHELVTGRDSSQDLMSSAYHETLMGATCIAMLHQKITLVGHEHPDRMTRRRLGISNPPLIMVIKLRQARIEKGKEDRNHKTVEWSCRWMCRGHWRQQPYKKQGVTVPIWIAPVIKGPKDKPLKIHADRIFSVSR